MWLFVWKYRKNIGIFIAVLAVVGVIAGSTLYVRHVISENDILTAEVKQIKADLKEERERHAEIVGALEEKAQDVEERQDFKGKAQKEIAKDRVTGDAPMAPVLRNAVDRLRERQAEFTHRRDSR